MLKFKSFRVGRTHYSHPHYKRKLSLPAHTPVPTNRARTAQPSEAIPERSFVRIAGPESSPKEREPSEGNASFARSATLPAFCPGKIISPKDVRIYNDDLQMETYSPADLFRAGEQKKGIRQVFEHCPSFFRNTLAQLYAGSSHSPSKLPFRRNFNAPLPPLGIPARKQPFASGKDI